LLGEDDGGLAAGGAGAFPTFDGVEGPDCADAFWAAAAAAALFAARFPSGALDSPLCFGSEAALAAAAAFFLDSSFLDV